MSTRASTTIGDLPTDAPELDAPEYVAPEGDPMDGVDETTPPYDDNGDYRWENADGEPVDFFGNVIPARYEETEEGRAATGVATPPAEEPDTEVPAPAAKPAMTFRAPFANGLLNQQERERAEQLADPEVLSLIETVAMRAADQIVAVRDQQRAVTRDLGIPAHLQDEVSSRMSAVEHLVPQEIRGTKQGANAALVIAAVQEAGEAGNVFDVFRKWSETPAPASPPPAPPRQPVPPMAPSQRSMPARPAPDNTRSARAAQKMVGTLTQDQIALIRAERKTAKNGR